MEQKTTKHPASTHQLRLAVDEFIPFFTSGFSTIPGGFLAGFLNHQQMLA